MSAKEGSSAKLAIVGIFAVAVVGAFIWMFLGGGSPRGGGEDPKASGSNEPSADAEPAKEQTLIRLLYSSEKTAWLEEAVKGFEQSRKDIKVEMVSKGSLDAVDAILEGKEKPTIWSPADFVAIQLLADDWKTKHAGDMIIGSGAEQPQPLVLTPLVFVAWEDRGKVLDNEGKGISWLRIHDAVASPKGWPGVGGDANWGFVKLGHTNPTLSNSGLQALLLMAHAVHGKRSGLEVSDVVDTKFQQFLETIEKGVPKFGNSTGTFMTDMVLYGPSKYDIVVTYESLAIQHIPNARGRWGNLRIYYPEQTMWSSHPAALMQGQWVTEAQKTAAKALVGYLRGKPVQQAALAHGFRPSDPSIPVVGGTNSPFESAKAFGVRLEIPPVIEPPPGPVIRNLMELWSRRIAR